MSFYKIGTKEYSVPEVVPGTSNTPLPPSVEEAYRRKCVQLKKRMNEVEESNDEARVRKVRLEHGIRKMRLERAYLLEMLGKRMKKNGAAADGIPEFFNDDSEGSSEGPPTPNDRPLRHKRSHRRPMNSSPPSMDYQMTQHQQSMPQGRYEQQPHQSHEAAYGVPNPNDAPAGYNPNQTITLLPQQQPALLANQVAQQGAPHPILSPLPTPEPFSMFFENNYLSQPHKHTGARTEEDLLKLAHETWDAPHFSKQRRMYEGQALKQRQAYDEQASLDYDLANREQQEATAAAVARQAHGRAIQPKAEEAEGRRGSVGMGRAKDDEQVQGRDVEMADTPPAGGHGGFTSIN